MAKLYNLARMRTLTTGTGAVILDSAIAGCISFADAGVQNGDQVSYGIREGNHSEVGVAVPSPPPAIVAAGLQPSLRSP